VFRTRAAVFGHNAPKYASLTEDARAGESNWDSPPRTLAAETAFRYVHLDATYPEIVPGGWLALESPVDRKIYRVQSHDEISRTSFTLSTRVSRVGLDSSAGFDGFTLRGTTVLAQSEPLEVSEIPIEEPVEGRRVMLDGIYLGLESGRAAILSGERVDLPGVVEREVHRIDEVTLAGGYTIVRFQRALGHAYVRSTVTIAANVAHATHGETVQEVLGSGDATRPFQEFVLRQPPLTWISADVPGGARPALGVWVDGVRWEPVGALFGHGADERIYVLAAGEDGATIVRFGDGRTGARLPTGVDNVRAISRTGIGRDGQVGPGQISLLLTRPVGVRGVINPLGTGGAGDPETAEDARRSVPLSTLTLGRVVSLSDYEDFARAFAGIGKALATWTWDGRRRLVLLTIAGPEGAPLSTAFATIDHLLAAVRRAGNPFIAVRVVPHRAAFFRVAANVKVDPDRQPPAVLATVEHAMRAAFAFPARAFGQPVTLAEVIATMQRTPGVGAVSVTAFHRTDAAAGLQAALGAAGPEAAGNNVVGAELLLLDPRPLELGVMP
jgi:predicted phage baseplate assembly protein